MVRFLSDIAMGRFDDNARSLLLRSRLVPVQKKSGGVRPVVIAEAFVRLAALCAMSLLPRGTVATLLAPLQLGIGTSNGVESALHLVQSHIDHNPTDVVLSLDIANGFNSIGMSCSTTSTPVAISMGFGGWRIGVMTVLLSWSSHRPRDLRLSPPLAELVKAVLLAPCSSRSPCNPSSSTWSRGSPGSLLPLSSMTSPLLVLRTRSPSLSPAHSSSFLPSAFRSLLSGPLTSLFPTPSPTSPPHDLPLKRHVLPLLGSAVGCHAECLREFMLHKVQDHEPFFEALSFPFLPA